MGGWSCQCIGRAFGQLALSCRGNCRAQAGSQDIITSRDLVPAYPHNFRSSAATFDSHSPQRFVGPGPDALRAATAGCEQQAQQAAVLRQAPGVLQVAQHAAPVADHQVQQRHAGCLRNCLVTAVQALQQHLLT